MTHKILSLNIGDPAPMEWKGKTILSSMKKHAVPGPIVVHKDHIEGNTFQQPEFHGALHSVLYAFGMTSALEFTKILGLDHYEAGATGETVTLDRLDEFDISVGDIFKFGTVLAEASYPRIPCGKVSFRMQHERGQKAMQECGRSGVYFRILEPGQIAMGDVVKRIDRAQHRLLISDVYRLVVKGERPPPEIVEIARKNGALPKRQLEKWSAI